MTEAEMHVFAAKYAAATANDLSEDLGRRDATLDQFTSDHST
jgi:hypothetical protein